MVGFRIIATLPQTSTQGFSFLWYFELEEEYLSLLHPTLLKGVRARGDGLGEKKEKELKYTSTCMLQERLRFTQSLKPRNCKPRSR